MKEADKLACLVLFSLFWFHSTVKARFVHRSQAEAAKRACEDTLSATLQAVSLDTTVSALKVTTHTAFQGSVSV